MGKVRPKLVKRAAHNIVKKHPEEFKGNFEDAKKAVSKLLEVPSKRVRNMIAGYAVRLKSRPENVSGLKTKIKRGKKRRR